MTVNVPAACVLSICTGGVFEGAVVGYDTTVAALTITQDLGLGMMLWMTHFFPEEDWALVQRRRCLAMLDRMWRKDGYFCREPYLPDTKFAFTNYGASVGLQAAESMPDRVVRLNRFFETYQSHDKYDRAAITHVMACSSHFPGLLIANHCARSALSHSPR